MSAEMNAMMEAITRLTQAMADLQSRTSQSSHPASPPRRKKLDTRYIKVEEFDGGSDRWDQWAFALKGGIRAQDAEAYRIMMKVEEMAEDLNEDDLEFEHDEISGEVYNILCQTCRGTAQSIIRSVDDCRGLTAWQRLHRAYNPRTVARTIQALGEVTRPVKVTDIAYAEPAINRWEEGLKRVKKDYKQTIGNTMRIAILANFMPDAIKDYIYVNVLPDTEYKDIIDKVRALIRNKAITSGPVPMDIGNVKAGGQGGDEEGQGAECGESDYNVDALGFRGKCNNCGGWGHFARECPTKSFGKGSKSGGKDGKGSGKGGYGGYGPKGGKGYQGACYLCGEIGHKKFECKKLKGIHGVDEEQDKSEPTVEMNGVWIVGQVEVKSRKEVSRHIVLQNSFEPLTMHEENEGELDTDEALDIINNQVEIVGSLDKMNDQAVKLQGTIMDEEADMDVDVFVVDLEGQRLTRPSVMNFNEANVRKPLASAVEVTKAGNRVVMEQNGGYIENVETGERMKLRVERNVFVYDVQMEDGSLVTVTLDSGAGCNVWPKGLAAGSSELRPPKKGMNMYAANGTPINYFGQRLVKFRGIELLKDEDFPRRT